jgi:hypothetical protein
MTRGSGDIHRTFRVGRHELPGVWRHLLPEDFGWMKLPAEELAECGRCPKVETGEYLASCRCCSYFPQLSNFGLGFALEDPEARRWVERVIDGGVALPEGMEPAPEGFVASLAVYAEDRFGKTEDVVCPFLDVPAGRCRVFAYRNSICASFFCDHEHGAEGAAFWASLQRLVGHIEMALAQWAMERVGMPPGEYIRRLDGLKDRVDRLSEPGTRSWTPAAREILWGEWYGREAEFFAACAEQVARHRDDLYEIASAAPFEVAFAWEQSVRDWVPREYRSEVPLVPEPGSEAAPIGALWYQLQLAAKNLWALPFGEGPVRLAEGVTIEGAAEQDAAPRVLAARPLVCVKPAVEGSGEGAERLLLTRPEAELLALFAEPTEIGEDLFERDVVRAVHEPRELLSRCLRRGLLVGA